MPTDIGDAPTTPPPLGTISNNPARDAALALFAEGMSLEEAAQRVGRARSTVADYLVEFIEREQLDAPMPWVSESAYGAIVAAIEAVGGERLRPIFEQLGERYSYDEIRLSLACWRSRREPVAHAPGSVTLPVYEPSSERS